MNDEHGRIEITRQVEAERLLVREAIEEARKVAIEILENGETSSSAFAHLAVILVESFDCRGQRAQFGCEMAAKLIVQQVERELHNAVSQD